MDNILTVVLQALPLIVGPLAVWAATWLVLKLKPTLTGKTITTLVVPAFSFIATVVGALLGDTTNPVAVFALNTAATFIAEFIKNWNKPTEPTP